MTVTNRDILLFFAQTGKDKKCSYTEEYMKTHNLTGEYIKLANTFWSKGQKGLEENKEYYQWLKEKKKSGFADMESLSAIMKTDPSFDALLENITQEEGLTSAFLQKWHLYISWYALEEYWADKDIHRKSQFTADNLDKDVREDYSGILRYKNPISCRALLLWMCEAAGSEQTVELYKELLDIEDELKAASNRLSEWLSKIKAEIYERVPHQDDQKQKEVP